MEVRPDRSASGRVRRPAVLACSSLVALASFGCASTQPAPPSIPDGSALVATLDPGQSRSSIFGCLAEAKQEEVATRGAGEPDDLSVRVVPGGAVVTHSLAHACCLEANTRLTIRGNLAILHERLAGKPCRCNCHSTIVTGLGLALGHWTVRVEIEQPDQAAQVIVERRVKVLEPRPEMPH
jgi:hypothetical protein